MCVCECVKNNQEDVKCVFVCECECVSKIIRKM